MSPKFEPPAPMDADELRDIRKTLGYTQTELGERLGLKSQDPHRQVRRWEAGEPISGPVAIAVRSFLPKRRS